MANITALKGKGTPPPRKDAPGNTQKAPREKAEETQALQLKIPQSVYEAFSEEAGRRHGFKKGAKTLLFLEMWERLQKEG